MKTPFALLKSTATIRKPTYTVDSSGANLMTYANSATVQCRAPQPLSHYESLQYGRETAVTMYKVFLAPKDTAGAAYTLAHDYQLVIAGVTYTVDGEPVDLAGNGTLTRVDVRLGPAGGT